MVAALKAVVMRAEEGMAAVLVVAARAEEGRSGRAMAVAEEGG